MSRLHLVLGLFPKLGAVLRAHGGAAPLAARVARMWREEGLHGIKRRIKLLNGIPPNRNDYREWAARYDTLSDADRSAMAEECDAWPERPLVSIVMSMPEGGRGELAVMSVLAQVYPHWELFLIGHGQPDWLERLVSRDRRIRLVPDAGAGQMPALSGEWAVLIERSGELAPHALYCAMREAKAHPAADFIYADDDERGADGVRRNPRFKPDWNPDLFLSTDYTGPMKFFRGNVLPKRDVSAPDAEPDSWILQLEERKKQDGIRHVARVLFHKWPSSGEAPDSTESHRAAVVDHLARKGARAEVASADEMPGGLHLRYEIPQPAPLVTLIIPTRNGVELLRRCLESIEAKTDYSRYEVIVVDNGSDESATLTYFETLNAKPNYRVLRDDGPFNFSRLNNRAAAVAQGAVLGLLNNDLEVINADWLAEMVGHALRPDIGAVGARLWFPDDTLQHAGVIMTAGVAGHVHKDLPRGEPGYCGRAVVTQNFGAVTAACLVIRRDIYQEVGGLDEDLAVAFNDIDFCMRVGERGYRNLWTPHAQLYHYESASRGYEQTPEKMERFLREVAFMRRRWGSALYYDPAYNLNLDQELRDFSLAWPPAGVEAA